MWRTVTDDTASKSCHDFAKHEELFKSDSGINGFEKMNKKITLEMIHQRVVFFGDFSCYASSRLSRISRVMQRKYPVRQVSA